MKKILIVCFLVLMVFPGSVFASSNVWLTSPSSGTKTTNAHPTFLFGYNSTRADDWAVFELAKKPDKASDGSFYSENSILFSVLDYPNKSHRSSYALEPGQYYWNVRLYNYDDANYTVSSTWKITILSPKPKTYAKRTSARRRGRRKIAVARLRWYVRDDSSKAYVKLRIQKRVKSRLRVKRKVRYLRTYRKHRGKYMVYKKKYRKTRNHTLRRRYQRAATRYKKAMRKYLRAYRRTKTVVYRTVKVPNYRWTSINSWRTYRWRTRSPGLYKYSVYAKDPAGNNQKNVASARFRIR